jgi:hypothetical protein
MKTHGNGSANNVRRLVPQVADENLRGIPRFVTGHPHRAHQRGRLELAFWPTDSKAANPDEEIINAARPPIVGAPGPVMLGASSPYARRRSLWAAYRDH